MIFARKVDVPGARGGEHMTTYGVTPTHCGIAARIAAALQTFMGWTPATKDIA